METTQGVTAEVDKLQQGWVLSKVVIVSEYDYVAVFTSNLLSDAEKPKIRTVRLACPVVLQCDTCPVKKHGNCKDNIITGEEAIKTA